MKTDTVPTRQVILLSILASLVCTSAVAQTRDRASIDVGSTWRLEDIYPSDESWSAAKDRSAAQLDDVLAFKGTLASDPKRLFDCLEKNSAIDKQLGRLFSYASMKSDQDTRAAKYIGMKQALRQLATDYQAKASFLGPEIAAMDKATIARFIEQEPKLRTYRMFLDDIQRTKSHRLSQREEKILAQAGLLASAPMSIYSTFSNAELPFPEMTLSDGVKVRVNQAGYARYRSAPLAADRRAVFDSFFGTFNAFRQTFGMQLSAQISKDIFFTQARRYPASLERALDADNIPVSIYHALLSQVGRNIGSFHRYLKLKKRMLGVAQLDYSDVYAPVVGDVPLQYSFDEARQLVVEAVAPLGPDYRQAIERAFDKRWIDVYPTPGKRAGAYCNGGCYDVHPYVLLNYNGQYDDVSTLAHELGHAMHSLFSNTAQPYPTADYATFVAEVASTLNEALLIHRMFNAKLDDNTKLALLMNYLDGIKGTVFRQTQFAQFEWTIHERAEKGEPLTGDALTEIYYDILKTYYGHDEGVCNVPQQYAIEWAYVPHFYLNFYVYQYATSFTASTALSQKIIRGDPDAAANTIAFLSAGGSDYPVAILKRAGVDMTTTGPFDLTMAAMNHAMDEVERILDRSARK